MFQLILTACLAASSGTCAPLVLPAGEAGTRAACAASAARITQTWLAAHPGLVGTDQGCVETTTLPALPLQEVAPGVHVFLGQPVQIEDSRDGHIANLAVVIGATSVAVIDSGISRGEGQALFAAIRRLTDLPVSDVILTHMHPDHVLGASVFREAGARVIGHHALPLALEMRAAGYLDAMVRQFGPQAMLGTEIVLPDILVETRLAVDLGGRVLHVEAAPAAHTDNDLSVRDEATGTMFAGDLIFRDLTPVLDGSLSGWLAWMATEPRPAPRLVVPGHGAPVTGWTEAVAPQRDFLDALAEATRAALKAGAPMSEAVPRIVDDLQSQAGGWNSFAVAAPRDATAAYKELEWE